MIWWDSPEHSITVSSVRQLKRSFAPTIHNKQDGLPFCKS